MERAFSLGFQAGPPPITAGSHERASVGWMLAARKRPGRPDPLAAKGAASAAGRRAQRSKPVADASGISDRPSNYGVRAEARRVLPSEERAQSRRRATAVGCRVAGWPRSTARIRRSIDTGVSCFALLAAFLDQDSSTTD